MWEGPKFRAFFFPSPAPIFALFFLSLSLSGCLLVEFWWSLKRRGPEMCTEFHTTAQAPKRGHLRAPVFKNNTKTQREDPQEKEERWKLWREREILGGPTEGGPTGKGGLRVVSGGSPGGRRGLKTSPFNRGFKPFLNPPLNPPPPLQQGVSTSPLKPLSPFNKGFKPPLSPPSSPPFQRGV